MSYEDGGMPAGGNSRFRGYPARMSERQQLALILQMTSQEMTSGPSGRSENNIPLSNARSSPLQQQKSSKSRWSNKNADLLDVSTSFNRQDERLRLASGCDSKERNEFAASPDEARTASGAESPVAAGSPAECAATAIPAPRDLQDNVSSSQQADDAAGASYEMRRTPPQNKVDRPAAGGGSGAQQQQQQQTAGNSGASNSPRVTLRLNQVRATREDKKATAGAAAIAGSSASSPATGANASSTSSSRQSSGSSTTMSSSQMEPMSTKSSSSASSSSTTTGVSSTVGGAVGSGGAVSNSSNTAGANTNSSSSSLADGGDVYEFKSSKEATPVRGSSSSPNPNPDKDAKDTNSSTLASSTSTTSQAQNVSGISTNSANATSSSSSSGVGSSTTSSSTTTGSSAGGTAVGSSNSLSSATGTADNLADSLTTPGTAVTDESIMMTTSPASASSATSTTSTKRAFECEPGQEDQDEEGRKRKKKDNTEAGNKEVGAAKGAVGSRQATGRNNPGIADKCAKSGKQATGTTSTKSGQSNTSANTERKSPSAPLNANSPKPSNSSGSSNANIPKGSTPVSTESDGEDERSKNSDCNSAPKVPPLKIVIPQSTTSEQEQGNRNGKNTSNRGHQLPYVVPSSNSNDSMDKDQSITAVTSGTTSPLDNSGVPAKNEEKKDFSGALDNESRSTHHQRVLRSSHRSGNGGNGATGSRESSSNMSGNGNHSNSSPLPTNPADRSNNSSPQQRHHSPTPESGGVSETGKSTSTDAPTQNSSAVKLGSSTEKSEKVVDIKKEASDSSESNIKKESGSETSNSAAQNIPVELHPRKRKMKSNKEAQQAAAAAATSASETTEAISTFTEVHPHDMPITNCYQLFLNIRKQIERRRKGLFPVQPKPPQGFKDYLMNRCTYVLAGNANKEPNINPPVNLMGAMKDLYIEQEKERYRLRMQHVVEKEKLVLSVEQEILRVHGRAARALANQSLPFSVCTILKDEEVYNVITPEQEEIDRNARSRYNGRLFLSWLQDVDDKWEKIKEAMLLRHHNEAESLHAVQRMDWEWKLKEVGLCEFKATPQIEDLHVPIVHVSDDFDLLPA